MSLIAGLTSKQFAEQFAAYRVPCYDRGELFDHLQAHLGMEGQHLIDMSGTLWAAIGNGQVVTMHDGTTTYLFGRTAKKGKPICSMN